MAGRDTIDDFDGAEDVIWIDGSAVGVSSSAEILALAQTAGGGDDVVIDFGGGNRLILEDIALGTLVESDFVII